MVEKYLLVPGRARRLSDHMVFAGRGTIRTGDHSVMMTNILSSKESMHAQIFSTHVQHSLYSAKQGER
jgi:hypothetical protein